MELKNQDKTFINYGTKMKLRN